MWLKPPARQSHDRQAADSRVQTTVAQILARIQRAALQDAEMVAVDLLGQAEHGPDSVTIQLTTTHRQGMEVQELENVAGHKRQNDLRE